MSKKLDEFVALLDKMEATLSSKVDDLSADLDPVVSRLRVLFASENIKNATDAKRYRDLLVKYKEQYEILIVSRSRDALAKWLRGEEETGFEAMATLRILETSAPKVVEGLGTDDEATKYKYELSAFLVEVRTKLGLPGMLGIYSLDDAMKTAETVKDPELRLELERYLIAEAEKAPERYTITQAPNGKPMVIDKQAIERLMKGTPASTKLNTLLRDGGRGTLSAEGESRLLRQKALLESQFDAALEQIQKQTQGLTFFEKFLVTIGSDRKVQLGLASRSQWILSQETKTTHDAVIQRRPKIIDGIHPFFISPKLIQDLEANPPTEEKLFQIDQPFKTIWLERTDGGPLFFLNGSTGPAWIMGALVHEEGPHAYFCETLVGQYNARTGDVNFLIYTTFLEPSTVNGRVDPVQGDTMPRFNEGTLVQTTTHDVVYWIFKKFRSQCAFANEKVKPIRVRIGSGSERTAIKINKIVRVMLKTERKEYERKAGREVDWSHKWEVMGHWRRVDTIGKDREGNYTVRGATWVVPHVKGKGDLVKKQRIVEGDEERAEL